MQARKDQKEKDKLEEGFYYSSKKLGTGANIPTEDTTNKKFADEAMKKNITEFKYKKLGGIQEIG